MEDKKFGSKVLHVVFHFFVIVFTAGGLLFLEGFTEALEPWVQGAMAISPLPDELRFHAAAHGALIGILFGTSLLTMLWKPLEKPLMLHFYFVGHFIFLGTLILTDPGLALQNIFVFIMFSVVMLILFATYSRRKHILRPSEPAVMNRTLLVMNGIALLGLLPYIISGVIGQIQDPEPQFRWGEGVALSLTLLYGGYLSATGRTGARTLGFIVAATYVFMGAAGLTIPDHPGSWGIWGGLAALVFGCVYAYMSVIDRASIRHDASVPYSSPKE